MENETREVPVPRAPATGVVGDVISDALYRAVVDSCPDITVVVYGTDLRYQHILGAALEQLGWRSEELLGRRPAEILPPEAAVTVEEHLRAALAGETRHYEHVGVRDPAAVWSATASPVRASDGRVVAGILVSRNVGGVRAVERARRESEERFAVALAAAPVVVFAQDADLRFLWANKTVLNRDVADILGRTDREVFPAELVEQLLPAKQRVISTDRGERLLVGAPSSGRERFFDVTLEPTHDDSGRVTGLVGAALDVTDLRHSEQRLQAALEAMLESVAIQQPIADADGRVVDFRIAFATSNARDFTGRGAGDLVGHTILELYPALGADFVARYAQVLRSGEALHFTAFPYSDPAGRRRLYDVAVTRLVDELLVAWRDVTGREAERQSIARAEAMRATSEQLQRALLPELPTPLPGLQFAAAYRPATETAEVGGDWFDVIDVRQNLPQPCVDVVVGDAEGHDGEAAALMARLSSVIRAESRRGVAPAAILLDLDAFHATLRTERLASVAIARIDPVTGDVRLVSAGHPPGIVVDARGRSRLVAPPPAPPIGAGPVEGDATALVLRPGDLLLLFSDGLLDPHADTDDALGAIARAAERLHGEPLQSLVDALADRTRHYSPSDDVVLLAVQRLR